MLSTHQLLASWRDIVAENRPHASIRIGDVQAVVAAHEEILTMRFIERMYAWADGPYYGLTLPDARARDLLVRALREADYLGVLTQHNWYFRPLSDMVIDHYGIKPERFFYAFENYYISKLPEFYDMFQDVKVLIVSGKGKTYRAVLERRYGWKGVVGVVPQWEWDKLDKARAEMDRHDYQVALVGAGLAGKILAAHAKETGHIGLDIGNAVDTCIQSDGDGQMAWDWPEVPRYGWMFGEQREKPPEE